MKAALLLASALWLPVTQPDLQDASTRPPWLDRGITWVETPVRYQVITSGRWPEIHEARSEAMKLAAQAVRDFASQHDEDVSDSWNVSAGLIHDSLLQQEFNETVESSFGPMQQVHMLLKFTPDNREAILGEWRNVERRREEELANRRLGQMGAGIAFILVFVSSTLGFLRADDMTKGYYTKRLFVGAGSIVASSGYILYNIFG